MEIHKHAEKLLHDPYRFLLRELAVGSGFKVGMQALSLDEFHNQVDGLRTIDSFVKLAYVLVIQAGLDADFSNSLFATLKVNQLQPIVLFYSNTLTRSLVEALFHHRIRSTSDLLPEMV
jgi:hypothetical protein